MHIDPENKKENDTQHRRQARRHGNVSVHDAGHSPGRNGNSRMGRGGVEEGEDAKQRRGRERLRRTWRGRGGGRAAEATNAQGKAKCLSPSWGASGETSKRSWAGGEAVVGVVPVWERRLRCCILQQVRIISATIGMIRSFHDKKQLPRERTFHSVHDTCTGSEVGTSIHKRIP